MTREESTTPDGGRYGEGSGQEDKRRDERLQEEPNQFEESEEGPSEPKRIRMQMEKEAARRFRAFNSKDEHGLYKFLWPYKEDHVELSNDGLARVETERVEPRTRQPLPVRVQRFNDRLIELLDEGVHIKSAQEQAWSDVCDGADQETRMRLLRESREELRQILHSRRRIHQAGRDQAGPDQAVTDQAGQDEVEPDQARPNQAGSDSSQVEDHSTQDQLDAQMPSNTIDLALRTADDSFAEQHVGLPMCHKDLLNHSIKGSESELSCMSTKGFMSIDSHSTFPESPKYQPSAKHLLYHQTPINIMYGFTPPQPPIIIPPIPLVHSNETPAYQDEILANLAMGPRPYQSETSFIAIPSVPSTIQASTGRRTRMNDTGASCPEIDLRAVRRDTEVYRQGLTRRIEEERAAEAAGSSPRAESSRMVLEPSEPPQKHDNSGSSKSFKSKSTGSSTKPSRRRVDMPSNVSGSSSSRLRPDSYPTGSGSSRNTTSESLEHHRRRPDSTSTDSRLSRITNSGSSDAATKPSKKNKTGSSDSRSRPDPISTDTGSSRSTSEEMAEPCSSRHRADPNRNSLTGLGSLGSTVTATSGSSVSRPSRSTPEEVSESSSYRHRADPSRNSLKSSVSCSRLDPHPTGSGPLRSAVTATSRSSVSRPSVSSTGPSRTDAVRSSKATTSGSSSSRSRPDPHLNSSESSRSTLSGPSVSRPSGSSSKPRRTDTSASSGSWHRPDLHPTDSRSPISRLSYSSSPEPSRLESPEPRPKSTWVSKVPQRFRDASDPFSHLPERLRPTPKRTRTETSSSSRTTPNKRPVPFTFDSLTSPSSLMPFRQSPIVIDLSDDDDDDNESYNPRRRPSSSLSQGAGGATSRIRKLNQASSDSFRLKPLTFDSLTKPGASSRDGTPRQSRESSFPETPRRPTPNRHRDQGSTPSTSQSRTAYAPPTRNVTSQSATPSRKRAPIASSDHTVMPDFSKFTAEQMEKHRDSLRKIKEDIKKEDFDDDDIDF